jgi:hypothetical protein
MHSLIRNLEKIDPLLVICELMPEKRFIAEPIAIDIACVCAFCHRLIQLVGREKDRVFTVIKNGEGEKITSVEVDGKPLNGWFIHDRELKKGAVLTVNCE